MDEKWKSDLEVRLKEENRELQVRVAAVEAAVGALSRELQRLSPDARQRLKNEIDLSSGPSLFRTEIVARAYTALGVS